MDKRVKEYLDSLAELEKQKKGETLIELGLYEKVPCPEAANAAGWFDDGIFWDNDTKSLYKKVPIEVTDEEFKEIAQRTKDSRRIKTTNSVASIMRVLAIIVFIAGFFAGTIAVNVQRYEFVALIIWAAAFVEGMFFLCFAEIIRLLNAINDK